MEWDKIYAINRNYIDQIARRYFAVNVEGAVTLIIDNLKEDEVIEVEVDWHMKNKDLGKRKQFRCQKLFIEKEDGQTLTEGQKLTIYKWGNSKVKSIIKDESGKVTEVHVDLTPEDKDFKKTTVVHWVPKKEGLYTKVILNEFTHLITVKKMEDNMKIEDILTEKTKFTTEAYAESQVNEEKHGAKIQFERRGFYVVDIEPKEGKCMELNFIPDGKTKSQSIISGKVDAKTLTKGDPNTEDAKKEKKDKKDKKKDKEDKKAKKEEMRKKNQEYLKKKAEEEKKEEEKKEGKTEEKKEEK